MTMPVDMIRYDLLAQDALRGVVKKVLADVAARGLPGDHHFFIAFNTRGDGVKMSNRLREKYPEEMTIVLQHQFWDLMVHEDHFDVGVSFNGIPERLSVPYAAIKAFFDPSVQFGLQFELATGEAKALKKDAAQDTGATTDSAAAGDRSAARGAPRGAASEPDETRPARPAARKKASPPALVPPAPEPVPAGKAAGAEVVPLDKFRKK
jgi:hypothetical protein